MGLFKGGSVGSGLTGWLDEVSIFHGALRPEEFSFQRDYPATVGTAKFTYAAAGSYQSPPQDWVVRAKLADLTVAADLNGGQANATVETSDDAFTTVSSSRFFPVQDGVNTYPLSAMQGSARMVRIRFDLVRGERANTTPVIDAFRVMAEVHGLELLGTKQPNRVVFVSQINFLFALGERLLPDRNQRLANRHRPACVSVCCRRFTFVRTLYPKRPATPQFNILRAADVSLPIC